MKKIFTLVAATIFSVALFAADRKPIVTLKADKNYEIVIDGQSYAGNSGMISLLNTRMGQHNIKVYQISRGFMFKKSKKVLVDASTFSLKNNSLDITVDFRGQIKIQEDVFDNNWKKGNNGRGMSEGGRNDRDQQGRDITPTTHDNNDHGQVGHGNDQKTVPNRRF